MEQDKRYGLVFPKMVKKPSLSSKLAIFNEDSDDEKISVSAEIRKESEKSINKKQTQIEVQKALKENPTVYEYDAVYEEMKQEKTVPKLQEKEEKKPLMKAAEIRKRENERRVEKKIQKEREAEGDEFRDKEAFVTSAYKKKLQQMQEEEEKEQRKQQLEAMMDVTKQNDLSGFYRHLLRQEVGEEAVPNITNRHTQPNDAENKDEEQVSNKTKHQSKTSEKRKSASPDPDEESDIPVNSGSEDEERKKHRKEYHREKISLRRDGKSHHSRNRSPNRRRQEISKEDQRCAENKNQSSPRQEDEIRQKKRRRSSSQEESPERHKEGMVLQKEEPVAVADEKNLDTAENNTHSDPMQKFVKRTMGEVFEAALKRYLERKQARESAPIAIPVAS